MMEINADTQDKRDAKEAITDMVAKLKNAVDEYDLPNDVVGLIMGLEFSADELIRNSGNEKIQDAVMYATEQEVEHAINYLHAYVDGIEHATRVLSERGWRLHLKQNKANPFESGWF